MNIVDYINELTTDQLDYAQQQINKRIAAIKEEPKVTLYVVSNTYCNAGYYLEEDFHKAKEHLVKIILSEDYTASHISHRPSDSPMITKIKVPQSEVKEYMELTHEIKAY